MLSQTRLRSRTRRPRSLVRAFVLFLSEFALILGCYALAACAYEMQWDLFWLRVNDYSWWLLSAVALAMQSALDLQGCYGKPAGRSRIELLLMLTPAAGVSLLVMAVLVYSLPDWRLPLPIMVLGGLFSIGALFVWRMLFAALFWSGVDFSRILFVGASQPAREIGARLAARPELKLIVDGYLSGEERGRDLPPDQHWGPLESLADEYARLQPDRVVIALDDPRASLPIRALLNLRAAGVAIEEVTELYEAVFGRVCSRELRPRELILHRDFGSRSGGVALQSIYTNLLALIAAAMLAPVMAAVALVVVLFSRGKALETETCIGFEGLPFTRFRFRTGVAEMDPQGGARLRATGAGRWLSKLRLDRLPELFNVLRGEMSLVGPRPHRTEFAAVLAHYYPYYGQRHVVKPGVLGWAQVNLGALESGRDARIEIEYDLYYIKAMSMRLDLYILLHSLLGP
jgi:lipopolysaccharide/colanic/teichoic acid biosynthesis glycosyltransferase